MQMVGFKKNSYLTSERYAYGDIFHAQPQM